MEKLNSGRETISQRAVKHLTTGLLAIALIITLSVPASQKVTAQVECIGACEAQYEACLRDQGSNPPPNGGCQAIYEACVDACVGQYASIMS
jgi:hypothetical protein